MYKPSELEFTITYITTDHKLKQGTVINTCIEEYNTRTESKTD